MRFFTPSFLLVICFVLGGMMFKSMSPRSCGTILPDDSIFVLTGDERRIPFAMRQMQKYPDADLYIIGAGAPISYAANNIKIETESKSTYQNALAIKDIVQRAGLDRLVLVTTEDHMSRAKYLLRTEIPYIEIVACPVALSGMHATKRLERWTIEYIKYIVTMFGIKEG